MSLPRYPAVIRVGNFEVDPASGEVHNGGETTRLQPQAVALLLVLLDRPGRVVSREELRRTLWPDTSVDFEDGLNHAIARLREALHDSAQAPTLIETVPRRGYRFIGTVERLGPAEPLAETPPAGDGGSPAPTASPELGDDRTGTPEPREGGAAAPELADLTPARRAGRVMTRRRLVWLVAGSFAVTLAALLAWLALFRNPPGEGIGSIAVLPLTNLSADRSQDYFADGITEELITELARSNSIRVVSRTSTLHYRGTMKTVPEIAAELGVDAIVEGSVQRSGDRVRVAVQLVRAVPERHLWAQSYEVRPDEVLELRSRAAEDIIRQVGRRIPAAGRRPHRVPPAAHEAYLLGWSFARQATPEGYSKSIGYFERAIEIDPEYALAYAELAESHAMLDFDADRRGEHFEKARALARRAVELAPDLPEARLREADLKFYWDWDWSQCDSSFRAARDLSPGSGDTREHYALCLEHVGRNSEALREFERTLEVDPLSVRSQVARAGLLARAGRHAEAVDSLRKAADLEPGSAALRERLGHELLAASRPNEALVVFIAASRLAHDPAEQVPALTEALRRGGPAALAEQVRAREQAVAQERLAVLKKSAPDPPVSPLESASLYARLGDRDKAFEQLELAFRERRPHLSTVNSNTAWDSLRGDARFTALLARMKLTGDLAGSK